MIKLDVSPLNLDEFGTTSLLICDWCDHEYEEGDEGDDNVHSVEFGSLVVAQCCYDKLCWAVYQNASYIVSWLERGAQPGGLELAGIKTPDMVRCGWCGREYRDKENHYVEFGSLAVSPCCFSQLEDAICRCIGEILDWLEQQSDAYRREAENLLELNARGRIAVCSLACGHTV